MKKNILKSTLLLLTLGLSSCVYSETMEQREAEGTRLQKELTLEVEKGERLKR